MSDVEAEDEIDEAPPSHVEEPTIDKDGYHIISNRGKFAAMSNPLQIRLEEERRKKEEREKERAKKEAAAKRAAAFGSTVASSRAKAGGGDGDGEGAGKKAGSPPGTPGVSPDVPRGELDERVKGMMRSGIVTKTRGTVVLSRGRGRGRGGAAGVTRADVSAAETTESPAPSSSSGGAAAAAKSDDTDSDDSTERRAAARAKIAQDLSAAASKVITSPADEAGKQRAANLIAQRRASRHSIMMGPPSAPATPGGPGVRPTGAGQGLASISEARATLLAVAAEVRSSQETDGSGAEERVPAPIRAPAPAAATAPTPARAPAPAPAPSLADEAWSDDEGHAAPAPAAEPSALANATRRLSLARPVFVSPGAHAQASMSYEQVLQLVKGDVSAVSASGLDPARPEAWLTPQEFQRVFEIDQAAFSALPRWHQLALRKKTKLFVRPTRGGRAGETMVRAA